MQDQTAGKEKFKTQMVCLKARKKPNEQSMDNSSQISLLEIISNCQWESQRNDVLSKISHAISKDPALGVKKLSTVEWFGYRLEFLPRSEHPAVIPPELKSKLPPVIYSIRIKLTLKDELQSESEKISKEEVIEIKDDELEQKKYNLKLQKKLIDKIKFAQRLRNLIIAEEQKGVKESKFSVSREGIERALQKYKQQLWKSYTGTTNFSIEQLQKTLQAARSNQKAREKSAAVAAATSSNLNMNANTLARISANQGFNVVCPKSAVPMASPCNMFVPVNETNPPRHPGKIVCPRGVSAVQPVRMGNPGPLHYVGSINVCSTSFMPVSAITTTSSFSSRLSVTASSVAQGPRPVTQVSVTPRMQKSVPSLGKHSIGSIGQLSSATSLPDSATSLANSLSASSDSGVSVSKSNVANPCSEIPKSVAGSRRNTSESSKSISVVPGSGSSLSMVNITPLPAQGLVNGTPVLSDGFGSRNGKKGSKVLNTNGRQGLHGSQGNVAQDVVLIPISGSDAGKGPILKGKMVMMMDTEGQGIKKTATLQTTGVSSHRETKVKPGITASKNGGTKTIINPALAGLVAKGKLKVPSSEPRIPSPENLNSSVRLALPVSVGDDGLQTKLATVRGCVSSVNSTAQIVTSSFTVGTTGCTLQPSIYPVRKAPSPTDSLNLVPNMSCKNAIITSATYFASVPNSSVSNPVVLIPVTGTAVAAKLRSASQFGHVATPVAQVHTSPSKGPKSSGKKKQKKGSTNEADELAMELKNRNPSKTTNNSVINITDPGGLSTTELVSPVVNSVSSKNSVGKSGKTGENDMLDMISDAEISERKTEPLDNASLKAMADKNSDVTNSIPEQKINLKQTAEEVDKEVDMMMMTASSSLEEVSSGVKRKRESPDMLDEMELEKAVKRAIGEVGEDLTKHDSEVSGTEKKSRHIHFLPQPIYC